MANSNMFNGSVPSGNPAWYNTPGYNAYKNRHYAGGVGSVEDLSSALGTMHLYSNNTGQSFNRMHSAFPHRMPPGIMSAAFNVNNTWNGSRFMMQNAAGPQMLPQGSQFSPLLNNVLPVANNGLHHHAAEVPDLARRNSVSSNEEFGPHTPYFPAQTLGNASKMVVPDNSPQTWNSPSTHHLSQSLGGNPQQLWREAAGYMVTDFDAICTAAPVIPRPIPAIFSGDKSRGTLETSLENKNKTTNVYIRGLHPDTTDEMLHAYGSRFGPIESAKSMIDGQTGLCKGFGFIKYQLPKDGENCIRVFYYWGYEAKWARDSHNDKLKKLGDDCNTNLYISNIPVDLDFNEHSLMAIFGNYDCISAKILRDTNGLSRGVGFARFATPEICRTIIQIYNGQQVGEDAQPISIRFADTPKQKDLKSITQERRQYKTHEYNVAAFGPDSPYRHMGPLVAAAAASYSPIPHNRSPLGAQSWIVPQSPYNMSFPVNTMSSIPVTSSVAADGQMVDNTPLAGRTGPRFTPYPVALNPGKTEVFVSEPKVASEDEQVKILTTLTKRDPNLPAKVNTEQTANLYGQRENSSAHGSTISSPVKTTPVKSSKSALLQKIGGSV